MTTNAQYVDPTTVASVYSGKAHACCCGCSGKHRYAAKYRDLSSEDRGYDVGDDEVSDRSVKLIVGKINKAIAAYEEFDGDRDEQYIALTLGERLYIAYFARHMEQLRERKQAEMAVAADVSGYEFV